MNSIAKVLAFILCLLATRGFGQSIKSENTLGLDTPENSPKATIAQLSWLNGEWIGEGLGSYCDEVWSSPYLGHMIGAFRAVKDGEIFFFEFLDIAEEEGSLVLKIKHFDKAMVGWEEKDESVSFRLVKITPNEANFDGLTYRKINDSTMEAYVVINYESGPKEAKFTFRKK